jgi:hypothetical protein
MSYNSFPSVESSEEINPYEDIYDEFIQIYFKQDLKIRLILKQKIINFIKHPVYTHLLQTMNEYNAQHIIGYFRSQRSVEMYTILDHIVNSPLPNKDKFYISST